MTSLETATADPISAEKHVTAGIIWSEAQHLAGLLDVPTSRLAKILKIAPATMRRRRISGRFTPAESERVVRYARLWFIACKTMGGPTGARSWLKRPQHGLGGRIPLDVASLEIGASAVETLLRRIDAGVLA